MSELTHEEVQKILKIIDGMGDRDVHLEIGDLKIHVTRGNAPPNQAVLSPSQISNKAHRASPAPKVAAAALQSPKSFEVPAGQVAVRAPTSGTFFRSASPGSKPFVEVGDHVEPDDIVCVFDVMKLFTSLTAGVSGTVAAIPVANETVVEQDQPLILIKPD